MCDHTAVKLHRWTRTGQGRKGKDRRVATWGPPSVTVIRQPAWDEPRLPYSTATLRRVSNPRQEKNAAETQEKSVETETESRGRVPSKCQALYKSALMEELCFQESTECSPAKCTWLALHTQTRAHVLMRGWRRSRAGPLHEARRVPRAMCNVMKSNSTVQLRKKKWWSIHDERTPDTRPTYWDWSVYSRLDTQMTVCRLFVNVGLRLSVKKSAFPWHRIELYILVRNLYFFVF